MAPQVVAAPDVDRSMLAARIQGFGNVNPPPLEEERTAKKIVGRVGDMLSEEIMLTVDDFKEKGAVGAVKDAVADAGDMLIDGAAAIFGWVRGDPPPEEENENADRAQGVLVNGPSGAAYGVQQASPSGGINAVWVMPEEADPATLAQLASQAKPTNGLDPRAPKNIQPYQDPRAAPPTLPNGMTIAPYQPQAPGIPQIAPYQPNAPRMPYNIPGVSSSFHSNAQTPAGMPGGFNPAFLPGAGGGYGQHPGASSGSSVSGARSVVERVAKGEMVPGPDVAKRLVAQCGSTSMSAKQLGELICERARRLYLGLDGSDPSQSDASLTRLLGLTDALAQTESKFAQDAVKTIREGVQEEFMSLQSSVKHKDTAIPMLRRIGMMSKAPDMVDLLGGDMATPSTAASASPAAQTDLLGGFDAAPTAAPKTDLLDF